MIADIANAGSNTYGGCGDINRNIMAPAVYFPNNPAYVYCMKYSKAVADLFKPMTESFKVRKRTRAPTSRARRGGPRVRLQRTARPRASGLPRIVPAARAAPAIRAPAN